MTSYQNDLSCTLWSPFWLRESTGIMNLITKITWVLLKCMLSFSWMTSQMSRHCTMFHVSSRKFSFRGKSQTHRACRAAWLHPSAICWWFLCWLCWDFVLKVTLKLQLAVKTIPGSSVTGVILYGQPHGLETVRSALATQCPFQARCQWGLYAALARLWHVSSFLLRLSFSPSFYHLFLFLPCTFTLSFFFPPCLCLFFSLFSFGFFSLALLFPPVRWGTLPFAFPPVKHKIPARWEFS